MKTVSVAAADRKLGKTAVVCRLVRELTGLGHSVSALKLRPMTVQAVRISKGPGREGSDTSRFIKAGAGFSALVDFPDSSLLPDEIERLVPPSDILIMEGGSAVETLSPDLIVYIEGGSGPARHPELADRAGMVLHGPATGDQVARAARLASALLGIGNQEGFGLGLKHWIDLDGVPILGGGITGILRSVRETGSILGASRATGIPYKRTWILISEAEERLGAKLIRSRRGGSRGGGSRLTRLGSRLLKAWELSGTALVSSLPDLEV
jgi:molybdate transport system regulatory protein